MRAFMPRRRRPMSLFRRHVYAAAVAVQRSAFRWQMFYA